MQVPEAFDQRVEGVLQVGRRLELGCRELLVAHHERIEAGAVEPFGELQQRGVALGADASEDVPNGVGDGGVDLEGRGLEPLPPFTEVEELEHHSSSAAS